MKNDTFPQNTNSRREFLKKGLKAGAALSLLGNVNLSMGQSSPLESLETIEKTDHPLKILILGGTSYLGIHQIAYALSRGHSITIFTRGKTKPTFHKPLFKEVEHLIGDREDNLEALKGRKWDAVIDNSGRKVAWTKATAELLRDSVDLYLYTSSTGVYYPYLGDDIKEDTSLVLKTPEEATGDQKYEYDYGVMKANSELAAQEAFGKDRTIIVRPTYMIGPGDRFNRFMHWPIRLRQGGEILVPGKADDPVQYIDGRDVANWMIRLIENGTTGAFNAVGPASTTGMHAFIYGIHAACSSAASFVMIPDYEFLEAQGIPYAIPWVMPTGNNYGTARANNQRSINNGLTFTPLADTIRDIYEWWFSEAVSDERRASLSKEGTLMAREKAILEAWRKR